MTGLKSGKIIHNSLLGETGINFRSQPESNVENVLQWTLDTSRSIVTGYLTQNDHGAEF